MPRDALSRFEAEVSRCRACPRLVAWLDRVDREKKRAFRDRDYWSRPVPGFGPKGARLLVLGLAPGAHGANRTGRPFTGDGAGPFLYSALARAGLANGVEPVDRDDGLELEDARVTNAVRCAPPGNRPTPDEARRCEPFLERELALLPNLKVILCLGGFAWDAALRLARSRGVALPRPKPRFGHGALVHLRPDFPDLVGAFHPSQLNTNTGRLTPVMMDRALGLAVGLLDRHAVGPGAKAAASRRRAKNR